MHELVRFFTGPITSSQTLTFADTEVRGVRQNLMPMRTLGLFLSGLE